MVRHLPLTGRKAGLAISTLVFLASSACAPTVRIASTGERSVKPGINAGYKNIVIDEWLNKFEVESREIFTHRDKIVDLIGLKPGITIADIGAGTGLFVIPFSKAVGSTGKLLAVDIVPKFLDHIRDRATQAGMNNVEAVLCKEESVELPPESVDVVFICDAYHHFEFPMSTMATVRSALKPGGELIVIDFERIPGVSKAWLLNHVRAGRNVVIAEITSAGFELTPNQPNFDFLEDNYIVRFRLRN